MKGKDLKPGLWYWSPGQKRVYHRDEHGFYKYLGSNGTWYPVWVHHCVGLDRAVFMDTPLPKTAGEVTNAR